MDRVKSSSFGDLEDLERLFKGSEGQAHHQRASSDSFVIDDEQPSWLDELLTEPEIPAVPVRKGHRRAASDSAASYLDKAVKPMMKEHTSKIDAAVGPPWAFQNTDRHEALWQRQTPFGVNPILFNLQHENGWERPMRNNSMGLQNLGLPGSRHKQSALPYKQAVNQAREGKENSAPKNDSSQPSPAAKAELKRNKQQSAHRARVRRLQYVAELERNVQILQAEGSEAIAGIEYLDQQNFILSMENRALKQCLDRLAQIQKVKQLEQDLLEREIGRLRYVHQQQLQKQSTYHQQSKSREVESQFANLAI